MGHLLMRCHVVMETPYLHFPFERSGPMAETG